MRRILAMLFVPSLISAQVISERVDLGVYQRIRDEGLTHSRIDSLAHHLTDVIGPRLTGSPGMRRANEWTAQQFRQWGLSNVQVEPWGEFGRGWERVSYSGRVTSPYVKELRAIPSGWTGSTKGTITARVAVVKGGLAELSRSPGAFAGQVVMLNAPAYGGAQSAHTPTRVPLDTLLDPTVRPPQPRIGWDTLLVQIRASQATRDAAVKASGAVAVLTASGTLYGMIRGGGDWAAIDPKAPEPLPELVLPQEEYNQLYRDAERQTPVTLELNVQNRFVTDDTKGYNTLADLPGSDKAGEYVMIGAHLDSWHYATGATDNGAGSIVMMEAMRILKTLGLTPRRTIRIGLWSGEEEGLYGSRGWVAKHPDLHAKISAYLNVDNGTGRIRGIWNQSNEKAVGVFEQILWPFRDLGVVAVRRGDTGGTDHLSFDAVGVPGFNFIQDPMEYGFWTHHTDLDTFDHLALEDLRQAAVVVAATAYELAMRDEMIPRK
jgi:carboxypeptidase Q